MNARSRQQAERFGRVAEGAAAFLLVAKGYRLLARRYRAPGGEIDLIARRGQVIAFVEVKARRTLESAIDAVTPTARKRIHQASTHWLARYKDSDRLGVRFDIIAVTPTRLHHYKDAWRPW